MVFSRQESGLPCLGGRRRRTEKAVNVYGKDSECGPGPTPCNTICKHRRGNLIRMLSVISRRRPGSCEKALYRVLQGSQRGVFYEELAHSKCAHLALRLGTLDLRQNNQRLFTIHSADLFQDFNPIHSRHVHIKKNDVWAFSAIQLKPIPSIVRKRDVITKTRELHIGKRTEIGLIINDQNLCQRIPRQKISSEDRTTSAGKCPILYSPFIYSHHAPFTVEGLVGDACRHGACRQPRLTSLLQEKSRTILGENQ
jgi:hypothetical protein